MVREQIGLRRSDYGRRYAFLTTALPFSEHRVVKQSAFSCEFSRFGRKLSARSGILELMDDLGTAMTLDPQMRMLGGGNPAPVPAMQELVRERMAQLLGQGSAFDRMLGNYDPPQGNPVFVAALAELLRAEFGWAVGPENVAITPGGQTAFFFLFNLLAGENEAGQKRKILLPLMPEYIGYADQGIEPGMFVGCRPTIFDTGALGGREFKYHIDFTAVERALTEHPIAAIAASRPTNPTGNMLSDGEVAQLARLAEQHGIPLILDNAYGLPFPGLLYVPAAPYWSPNTILTFSFSKLGLPGTRTGIVVAPEPIARAVASMTAIAGLANGNVGQQIVLPWIQSRRILAIGPQILRPFYEERRRAALDSMQEFFNERKIEWAVHASEGAFFHWLWLKNLRITAREFYERLKARKVLTVPGEYFFFGLDVDWPHRHECLRLNFSQDPVMVREALRTIAEEAARWQK